MVKSTCPRYFSMKLETSAGCLSSASIAWSVQGISETERISPRINPCSCLRTVSGATSTASPTRIFLPSPAGTKMIASSAPGSVSTGRSSAAVRAHLDRGVGSDQQVDDLAGVGRDDPGIALEPGLEQGQPGLRLAHGELPLQAGAAAGGLVAHPVVGDLVQPRFVGGDAALDLVGLGLRLEGIAIADHPPGLQALVAGDNPPVGGQSRPIELQAALERSLELPLGLGLRPGFILVELGHPRVFLTEPRQLGRGGSHLVPQLLLVDLGQHVARAGRSNRSSPRPSPAAPSPAP